MWMGANGVFFMHLGDFYEAAPKRYSKDEINKIKNEVTSMGIKQDERQRANVIIIMNESFSDPSKIQNVEFSFNPLEDIQKLCYDKNCYIGNAVTPVYGGGTSLPEFEALTGLSSFYLERQVFPYTSYIKGDINSLVRTYKNAGYNTIGVHPYKSTFYNRYKVYKYLGFDKTIFEDDIENAEIKGEYISENEFANQIIKSFEEDTKNKFIFGVTMQNHMPYNFNRYDNYDIEITSDVYSKEAIDELRAYVQGVYDGNKMYFKLTEYLKNIDEPTILVMFGDHLPAFKTANFYSQSNYSFIDMYTTPYVVWSNYDVSYDEFSKYMSPGNISMKTAKLAGLNLPWYFAKFDELYNEYPAINNQCAINRNNTLFSFSKIEKSKLIEECEILQYDLLIKKKYIDIVK